MNAALDIYRPSTVRAMDPEFQRYPAAILRSPPAAARELALADPHLATPV